MKMTRHGANLGMRRFAALLVREASVLNGGLHLADGRRRILVAGAVFAGATSPFALGCRLLLFRLLFCLCLFVLSTTPKGTTAKKDLLFEMLLEFAQLQECRQRFQLFNIGERQLVHIRKSAKHDKVENHFEQYGRCIQMKVGGTALAKVPRKPLQALEHFLVYRKNHARDRNVNVGTFAVVAALDAIFHRRSRLQAAVAARIFLGAFHGVFGADGRAFRPRRAKIPRIERQEVRDFDHGRLLGLGAWFTGHCSVVLGVLSAWKRRSSAKLFDVLWSSVPTCVACVLVRSPFCERKQASSLFVMSEPRQTMTAHVLSLSV